MTTEPLSELDALMRKLDTDPCGLVPRELDLIVAHCRQGRANAERGVKATKAAGERIDLKALGLVKAKPAILRRV